MKKLICLTLAFSVFLLLTACGGPAGGGSDAPAPSGDVVQAGDGVVRGIVNRLEEYLVLLTEEGEYLVLDLGEGVSLDGLEEGDGVAVTYTGDLEADDPAPVAIAIVRTD